MVCSLLDTLVRVKLRSDTKVLEVIMKEGVETLGKHVSPVQLEVLVSSKSLLRVQLDHVTYHPL